MKFVREALEEIQEIQEESLDCITINLHLQSCFPRVAINMEQKKENHIVYLSNIQTIFNRHFNRIEEKKDAILVNIECFEALHTREWDSLEEQVNSVWADALELQNGDMKDLCEDEEFDFSANDCILRNHNWKTIYEKLKQILGYMIELEKFKECGVKKCSCCEMPR